MEIRTTKEQATLAIRTSTPVENLSQLMGPGYGEIMQVAASAGTQPVGPPFALYYNMDMSNLDVEIGFPVSRKVEGKGRVKAGILPGGKAAVTLHVGPYDRLGESYSRLKAFVEEQGLETKEYCYEFYLNDPNETPAQELKTEIYFPVKG